MTSPLIQVVRWVPTPTDKATFLKEYVLRRAGGAEQVSGEYEAINALAAWNFIVAHANE